MEHPLPHSALSATWACPYPSQTWTEMVSLSASAPENPRDRERGGETTPPYFHLTTFFLFLLKFSLSCINFFIPTPYSNSRNVMRKIDTAGLQPGTFNSLGAHFKKGSETGQNSWLLPFRWVIDICCLFELQKRAQADLQVKTLKKKKLRFWLWT